MGGRGAAVRDSAACATPQSCLFRGGTAAACDAGAVEIGATTTAPGSGAATLAKALAKAGIKGKVKVKNASGGKLLVVTVKLTKKGSNAVLSAGKLKAKISVSLAAPGATPVTASRKAKLKAP